MLSLIVVAMVTVAAGFVVWANDKRHAKYGISVPAGIAASVGMLSWIIFIAAGFGYQPGLTWIPWVLPVVLGTAAAVAAVLYLGRTPHPPGHGPAHRHPEALTGPHPGPLRPAAVPGPAGRRPVAFFGAQAQPVPLRIRDHHPTGCVVTVH